jgi:hypothetical protein
MQDFSFKSFILGVAQGVLIQFIVNTSAGIGGVPVNSPGCSAPTLTPALITVQAPCI